MTLSRTFNHSERKKHDLREFLPDTYGFNSRFFHIFKMNTRILQALGENRMEQIALVTTYS